jgi:integral membrane sensor domain MASE1
MGVIVLVAFAGVVPAAPVVPITRIGAAAMAVTASPAAMGNMTAAMAATPVAAAVTTRHGHRRDHRHGQLK